MTITQRIIPAEISDLAIEYNGKAMIEKVTRLHDNGHVDLVVLVHPDVYTRFVDHKPSIVFIGSTIGDSWNSPGQGIYVSRNTGGSIDVRIEQALSPITLQIPFSGLFEQEIGQLPTATHSDYKSGQKVDFLKVLGTLPQVAEIAFKTVLQHSGPVYARRRDSLR